MAQVISKKFLLYLQKDCPVSGYIISEEWKSYFHGPTTGVKGKRYAKAGHVLRITEGQNTERAEDDYTQLSFSSTVKGSSSDYKQYIDIFLSPLYTYFNAECSCPVGARCKHIYATFHVLSDLIEGPPVGDDDPEVAELSYAAEKWLQQIQAKNKIKKKTSAKKSVNKQPYLGYLLAPSEYNERLKLYFIKVVPTREEGTFSVHTSSFNPPEKPLAYHRGGDLEILLTARRQFKGQGYLDNMNVSRGTEGHALLKKMLETGRLFFSLDETAVWERKKVTAITTWADDLPALLDWKEEEGKMQPYVKVDKPGSAHLFLSQSLVIDDEFNTISSLAFPNGETTELAEEWENGPAFSLGEVNLLQGNPTIRKIAVPPSDIETKEISPEPEVHLEIFLDEKARTFSDIRADLSFSYHGKVVPFTTKREAFSSPIRHLVKGEDGKNILYLINRAEAREEKVDEELSEMFGFQPLFHHELEMYRSLLGSLYRELDAQMSPENRYSLDETIFPDANVTKAIFFSKIVPKMEALGWKVTLPKEGVKELEQLESTYGSLETEQGEDGIDWFRFDAGFTNSEGEEISLYSALAEFLEDFNEDEYVDIDPTQQIYTSNDEGRVFSIPAKQFIELAKKVQDLFHNKGEKLDRVRAASFADDFQLDTSETLKALAELGKKLKSIKEIPQVQPPKEVKADLRPYQLEGFQWLQFLHDHQLNGILADDMGLGKTLQTLTHLLAQRQKEEEMHPFLVVAPTSVTGNWLKEAEKFTPTLKVLLLHGPERKEYFNKLDEYDLVITSYALVTRDEEALEKQPFHTIVLDEAQYIKNAKAKVSQIVCKLSTRYRLCLSGTPLENHLGELWSLSRFLMPGLLGDQTSFRKLYRTPIEKHGESTAQLALNRKVAPLLLRRTKEEVAKELPAKTEITNTVTLGKEQTTLYEAIRATMDKKVRDAIASKGVAQSQIIFLEALMKLRQTCCDPRLLKDQAGKAVPSAKFDHLTQDLLPTMLSEGRKILLFSQFTSMLSLIEAHLKAEKITYTKLTGATRKRQEAIDTFQEGDAQIFLISLKAGGTGLNLTAADTVIHYDPWWNPAAENQATDRAHRMGQTKPVFVHRLICKGSIEERIQELQKKKTDLAESLLSGSMKKVKLDEKTLNKLLAPLT